MKIDPRTCDDCGETFDTITQCKLHDCPDTGDGSLSEDYNDPFSPERDGEREMRCLHCGNTFNEQEIVYEERHGQVLWWCPTEGCDGKGVGIDIHEKPNSE